MLRISPVGLAAAQVANQLSILATFKEQLCREYCIDSSNQPFTAIEYSHGEPILRGTTVFIPITARISITLPGCRCNSQPAIYTEQFYVAFQGQTAVPNNIEINSVGRLENGSCVNCGIASYYSINDSLTITITPPAA